MKKPLFLFHHPLLNSLESSLSDDVELLKVLIIKKGIKVFNAN